jgi:hypothetical protein
MPRALPPGVVEDGLERLAVGVQVGDQSGFHEQAQDATDG